MTPSAARHRLGGARRTPPLLVWKFYSLSLISGVRRVMSQLPQTHPKKILRLFLGAPGEALIIRNFANQGSTCSPLLAIRGAV